MSEPLYGVVVATEDRPLSSFLVGDHPVGSTSLTVDDIIDFPESGGDVVVGSETLTYTGTTETEDTEAGTLTYTLTLSSATADAHDDGDGVVLDPEEYVRTAVVQVGDPDEAIAADVPHGLVDKVDVSYGDDGVQVRLEKVGEGYEIADVIIKTPEVDGGYLADSTVGNAPLSDNAVDNRTLGANAVDAPNLAQNIDLASTVTAGGTTLDPDTGIVVKNAIEQILLAVGDDPVAPIQLEGDIIARALTVLDNLTLTGTENHVSSGAVLHMDNGIMTPQQSPTVTAGHDSVTLALATPQNVAGLCWDGSGWVLGNGAQGETSLRRYATDGTYKGFVSTPGRAPVSVAYDATSDSYWVTGPNSLDAQQYTIIWTGQQRGATKTATTDTFAASPPIVGQSDGSGDGFCSVAVVNGVTGKGYRLRRHDHDGTVTSTCDVATSETYTKPIGVYYGQAGDTNTARFFVAWSDHVRAFYGGTGNEASGYHWTFWPKLGFCWDGSSFHAYNSAGNLITYTGLLAASGGSDGKTTLWLSYTWSDGTHETPQSIRRQATINIRSKISVQIPPMPTGVTEAKVYMGTGDTDPGASGMHYQDTITTGRTLTLTANDNTSANPPTTNDFPDATAARLALGQVGHVDADGTATLTNVHITGNLTVDGTINGQ